MRGFLLSSLFYVLLLMTLLGLSRIVSNFFVLPHPSDAGIYVLMGNTALSNITGKEGDCFIDVNTFGDLSQLDKPEVRWC